MGQTAPENSPHYYDLTTAEVQQYHNTSASGLTSAEVEQRRKVYGPNELENLHTTSAWQILFKQFQNALIIILLVATVISAFLGHGVEAIAIIVIVLFALTLGFVQEYRAERALEALRELAAPLATVLRDGLEQRLPARELVPGDLIVLHAGDKVPADARIVESINLKAEEAVLTGESLPVEKIAGAIRVDNPPLGEQKNMLFSGTAIAYGRGRGIVTATGMLTEFGKIAQMLAEVETGRTPLQENLDRVGRILVRAALVMVAVIIVAGVGRGQPFVEMLIFGVALAVAVVPEALPAVVTISLALGVQRMAKRNALVRRLPAVETLGCTSVICSDKTGTLTKDEMTVRKLVLADEEWQVAGSGYEPVGTFTRADLEADPSPQLLELLRAGALVCDARLARAEGGVWELHGDPTEGALVVAAAKAGLIKMELEQQFPRLAEIPFTSESKRMTTLHRTEEGGIAYAKGAPEVLLESCSCTVTMDGERPLNDAERQALLVRAQELASDALRVLAVTRKAVATVEKAETGMCFLGLIGMIDPPRPEVATALRTCEAAGIKTVMITGDHPLTARAIAHELGMSNGERIITGPELEMLSDEELTARVEKINVYARVSPVHKLRVVEALQQLGYVTAMTGDGVNDAPALKKADVGIAMGITGTDVSKEAAAMTLTDDHFASIVAAVEEGRGIFGNIKKYLMYLLSSNIGEIGLMAVATIAGLPLPLTAVQILYVNLATDGLPALALAVDPPDDDIMSRAPRNPRSGIFTRPVVFLMLVGGLWSTLINIVLFVTLLHTGRPLSEAMTLTFLSLVLIQFFKTYNFRCERKSVFHRPFSNRWLNLAIVWEMLLLLVIVYLPFAQQIFGTFSVGMADWLLVICLSFTVTPVLEIGKWFSHHCLMQKSVQPSPY